MTDKTFDELMVAFYGKADAPSHRQAILDQGHAQNATHLVLFQNVAFDSSAFGRQSLLFVGGPDNTYKSVAETEGVWLNDLPSQRQYPQTFSTLPGAKP